MAATLPAGAAENLERLAAVGLDGRFGFYESIDYNPRSREIDTPQDGIDQTAGTLRHERNGFAHRRVWRGMAEVARVPSTLPPPVKRFAPGCR